MAVSLGKKAPGAVEPGPSAHPTGKRWPGSYAGARKEAPGRVPWHPAWARGTTLGTEAAGRARPATRKRRVRAGPDLLVGLIEEDAVDGVRLLEVHRPLA